METLKPASVASWRVARFEHQQASHGQAARASLQFLPVKEKNLPVNAPHRRGILHRLTSGYEHHQAQAPLVVALAQVL